MGAKRECPDRLLPAYFVQCSNSRRINFTVIYWSYSCLGQMHDGNVIKVLTEDLNLITSREQYYQLYSAFNQLFCFFEPELEIIEI